MTASPRGGATEAAGASPPSRGPSADHGTAARSGRLPLLAFVADAESERQLRDGLSATLPDGFEVRRGTIRTAMKALERMETPRALILDIAGEDQALSLLASLRNVALPDVKVMLVGDRQDLTFYRQMTRDLGATEYLYKPLMPEMVARHFGAQLGSADAQPLDSGGRMVCLTGVRGGVGATTLVANLAWRLGETERRHTVLLDADLHAGTAAAMLGSEDSPGLRSALEHTYRMDESMIENCVTRVRDRLHVAAIREPLTDQVAYRAGAGERLVLGLRRRFNYVIADAAFSAGPFARDLMAIAQQRVLVLAPMLGAVREAQRLLNMTTASDQVRRPVVVLNRAGMPGGLRQREIEDALGIEIDVSIRDLPQAAGQAESLGEPASHRNAAFRDAIAELARQIGFFGSGDAKPGRRWWRA